VKRDLDLIREILLAIENGQQPLDVTGRAPAEICYNVQLLIDRRFIEGKVLWGTGARGRQEPMSCFATRITMDGHDYLDSVRDSRVWERTKRNLEKVGGSGPLEFIQGLAAKVLAELIKSSAEGG
jgi:Hypothetical protein (DUF2513)